MDIRARNNVQVSGEQAITMVFAHGFGCDHHMWRFVWPSFADTHRVVLLDHVGHGGADAAAFDRERYASLEGYADDLLEICDELDLTDVRSAMAQLRVRRVRAQVRDGTYHAPVQKVAEAIIASSLLGLPPDPRFLAWAG